MKTNYYREKMQWKDDYHQAAHAVREQVKAESRRIIDLNDSSDEEKYIAAFRVLRCLFLRSVEAHIDNYGFRKSHPSFRDYTAMILKNGSAEQFPEPIRERLIQEFGLQDGILHGTYYV